jgi:hypothetical protein
MPLTSKKHGNTTVEGLLVVTDDLVTCLALIDGELTCCRKVLTIVPPVRGEYQSGTFSDCGYHQLCIGLKSTSDAMDDQRDVNIIVRMD